MGLVSSTVPHNMSTALSFCAMKTLMVKGLEFLLDDDVYEKVCKYNWSLANGGHPQRCFRFRGYAICMKLAWEVIGVPPIGLEVDHADRNPRNNQRNNLRFATRSEQLANQLRRNKSGFRGVYFEANRRGIKKYSAKIAKNKHVFHLGNYPTAEEASEAYNRAAKYYYGPFALK